jgi:Uma2 family endonuclease
MSITTVTPAARMTAEEFGLRHSGDTVEYIDGVVTPVSPGGAMHGFVCANAAFEIARYNAATDRGHGFSNNTFVKVPTESDPERVYGPDVCYASYTRLAKDAEIPAGILPVTPELVVEVRSPSDEWSEAIGKMLDYIRAGVPVVVVLDPKTRSASVFRNQDRQDVFEADETLALSDVLPGFSVPVARFFE